mmetsp:Transcript_27674/g.75428  ORF Transcript_27674/g.75428 Transcript_27674/m.75428 type:complete len:426 (-) Transcript_27674:201-1478(-)
MYIKMYDVKSSSCSDSGSVSPLQALQWTLVFILLIKLGFDASQFSKLPAVGSNTAKKQLGLSNVELFIPIPPNDDGYNEIMECLLPTSKMFWPMDQLRVLFLTDKEAGPKVIKTFSKKLKSALPDAKEVRVASNTPAVHIAGVGRQYGHNRQQYVMFWADNFTDAEYVAFWDTDAMFVTRVLDEDLFDGNKPRVIAQMVGGTNNAVWEGAAENHRKITGKIDVMNVMFYFPVVVRLSDLPYIRASLMKSMDCQTFDQAFQKMLNIFDPHDDNAYSFLYSQFSLMLNIIYRDRPQGYSWHIHPSKDPKANAAIASVPAKHLTAYPRIAAHWTWMLPANKALGIDTLMLEGYCYSQPDLDIAPQVCQQFDVENTINHFEWEFEHTLFWGESGLWPDVLDVHRQRRVLIKSKPLFAFDKEWLDSNLPE